MERHELMLFALRAVRDWELVPVLRDALLEHPATRDELERSIANAAKWAKEETRNHVVVMYPRMLSPTWRARKGFDQTVFAIYEFDSRRHGNLAGLIEALHERNNEPVVPIYGARAWGSRNW